MNEILPEDAALILSEQIYRHLRKITDGEEPDEETKADISQLYNQAGSLLVDQGYREEVSRIQQDNEPYFNHVLMWASATRVLDKTTDLSQVVIDAMTQTVQNTRKIALNPPQFETYCVNIPEPYKGLIAVWFTLDTFIQRGRYQVMRDAANKLIE